MRLVTFNPYRTLKIPGVQVLKPEQMFRHRQLLAEADWVLFPETWQVNSLVYGLKARIFPSVASYRLGYDKVETTRALWASFPEHVPETLILPATPRGLEEALERFSLPFVVKEPRSSMGRGVRLIQRADEARRWLEEVEVLYVQEYLPLEADLRVVWVGDRVLQAYWRRSEGFLKNVAQGGEVDYEDLIPAAAIDVVTRVATHLGIDHAGFDVALVDGHPYVLELNLFFGNQGLNQAGIVAEDTILDYLSRTLRPHGDPEPPLSTVAG